MTMMSMICEEMENTYIGKTHHPTPRCVLTYKDYLITQSTVDPKTLGTMTLCSEKYNRQHFECQCHEI